MNIELREVRHSDMPTLFELQRDNASNVMAGVAARDKPAFDEHWAKNILGNPRSMVRVIVDTDAEGAPVVGNVVSFDMEGRRMFGYWIARNHWGRGIASIATAKYLADHDRERPLHAIALTSNGASLRVLEKNGFRRNSVYLEKDGAEVADFELAR